MAQPRPAISVMTWIEVLVGCRGGEPERVELCVARLSLDHATATTTVELRQRHGLKVPDAILLATATCHGLTLATRNSRDFPLNLGCVCIPISSEGMRGFKKLA
jgi:predicted nucleic acid-binding protein